MWRCPAGWAVSAFYGYLQGVNNDLALKHVPHVIPRKDNLAGPAGRRGDQVCTLRSFIPFLTSLLVKELTAACKQNRLGASR